jgi:hypothetical protein
MLSVRSVVKCGRNTNSHFKLHTHNHSDENCYNFAIDDIKSIIAKHKLLALSGSWSDESAEGVKREIAKLKRGGE